MHQIGPSVANRIKGSGHEEQTANEASSNGHHGNAGRGFFIYFRLYGPEEEFFDGTWKLADIARVK